MLKFKESRANVPMRNTRLPVMQASKPAASKRRSWHWSARNTCRAIDLAQGLYKFCKVYAVGW